MSNRELAGEPVSKHLDRQPANISGTRHPSVERQFNREAEPVEMHHHLPEKSADEIMSDAHREHAERKERHERTR